MPHYYEQILERLKSEAEKRDLNFLPEAPSELAWIVEVLGVRPRNRTWYGVEGNMAMVLGVIFVPEPERKHNDVAWNRIDEPLRSKLRDLENHGWRDKRISLTLIQVWDNERRIVLIPLNTLQKVSAFTKMGDFRVKQDGAMYYLPMPRGEDPIYLSTSLSDLFRSL